MPKRRYKKSAAIAATMLLGATGLMATVMNGGFLQILKTYLSGGASSSHISGGSLDLSYNAGQQNAAALNHNPANISLLKYQEITLEHNQWAEGITQEYGAYVHPKRWGTFGGSINMFQAGTIQGYDNSGGSAGNVTAQDYAATFGFATNVWGRSDPLDGTGQMRLRLSRPDDEML